MEVDPEHLLDLFQEMRSKECQSGDKWGPGMAHLCPECGGRLIVCHDTEACESCARSYDIFTLDMEDLAFADRGNTLTMRTIYTRGGHLKTLLGRAKGEGLEKVPLEVMQEVRKSCKGRCMPDDVRGVLKAMGRPDLYQHCIAMASSLGGKVPVLSHEIEETFLRMFEDVERAFKVHKPTTRKNMLNYGFILNKFCMHIGRPDLCILFRDMKPGKQRAEQERIWKKIEIALQWI